MSFNFDGLGGFGGVDGAGGAGGSRRFGGARRGAGFRDSGVSGMQDELDPTPLQPGAGMQFPVDDKEVSPATLTKRRIIAFSIAIPLATVLAVAGIYLVVLQVWSLTSRGEVAKENFAGAVSGYSKQLVLSALTPLEWLANYNLGTSYLLDGQVEVAIEYLESALVEVPKAQRDELNTIQYFSYECTVRSNLAAAYTMDGQTELAQETLSICISASSSGSSSGSGGGSGSESDSTSDSGTDSGEDNQDGQDGQDSQSDQSDGSDSDQNSDEQNDDSSSGQDDGYGEETDEERERREQLENKNQQHSEEQQANEEQQNAGRTAQRGW